MLGPIIHQHSGGFYFSSDTIAPAATASTVI
jgi:hypothetical protein